MNLQQQHSSEVMFFILLASRPDGEETSKHMLQQSLCSGCVTQTWLLWFLHFHVSVTPNRNTSISRDRCICDMPVSHTAAPYYSFLFLIIDSLLCLKKAYTNKLGLWFGTLLINEQTSVRYHFLSKLNHATKTISSWKNRNVLGPLMSLIF